MTYDVVPRHGTGIPSGRSITDMLTNAKVSAALNRQDAAITLRANRVVGEGTIARLKVMETAGYVGEAMSRHAGLSRLRHAQAADDPVLHAELGSYLPIFYAAAADIASDMIDSFCRESRGMR